MNCTICSKPLSSARLAANPTAQQCVPCLTAAGDVPLLRRYDEPNHEMIHQTYYRHDAMLDAARERSMQASPHMTTLYEDSINDDEERHISDITLFLDEFEMPEELPLSLFIKKGGHEWQRRYQN